MNTHHQGDRTRAPQQRSKEAPEAGNTTAKHRVPLTIFTVIMNNHGEVLLMRRANTGFGDGQYSLPGGHVEKHERIADAAKREVLEETSIHLADVRIQGVIHSDVDREYLHFVAVATHQDWTGEARNMEPDQCDHIAWYPGATGPKTPCPASNLRWRTSGRAHSSANTSPTGPENGANTEDHQKRERMITIAQLFITQSFVETDKPEGYRTNGIRSLFAYAKEKTAEIREETPVRRTGRTAYITFSDQSTIVAAKCMQTNNHGPQTWKIAEALRDNNGKILPPADPEGPEWAWIRDQDKGREWVIEMERTLDQAGARALGPLAFTKTPCSKHTGR